MSESDTSAGGTERSETHAELSKSTVTLSSVADSLEHAGMPNQARECRRRAESLKELASKICIVCGREIPDEYGKWDDDAPVYADDYVVHKGCEDEMFEWPIELDDDHTGGRDD